MYVTTYELLSQRSLTDVLDNASVTLGDVTIRPSPNLWLAIFDPIFELEQALDSGYISLNPINANGMSSINLNLNLIQLLNGTHMNYYGAWKPVVCRFGMLTRTYSSFHLDNPVSELGL